MNCLRPDNDLKLHIPGELDAEDWGHVLAVRGLQLSRIDAPAHALHVWLRNALGTRQDRWQRHRLRAQREVRGRRQVAALVLALAARRALRRLPGRGDAVEGRRWSGRRSCRRRGCAPTRRVAGAARAVRRCHGHLRHHVGHHWPLSHRDHHVAHAGHRKLSLRSWLHLLRQDLWLQHLLGHGWHLVGSLIRNLAWPLPVHPYFLLVPRDGAI
mmetsp:Transcript_20762/g.57732  ORF Transcript_20762/g.57732 Transcript_20762/m.57732 type:complete len:213 (+) Transcript_20762:496-1134(+)